MELGNFIPGAVGDVGAGGDAGVGMALIIALLDWDSRVDSLSLEG